MRNVIVSLLLALVVSSGCNQPEVAVVPPRGVTEIPVANLPEELRPKNWVSATGSGSCVNASTVYMLRWRGEEQLADWWRKNHAGGETSSSIRSKHDAVRLPYVYTLHADPTFLDWCTKTRRGCIIWFYESHCVTFVGWANEGGRTVAKINDNNRPGRYISIERSEFLRRWRGYGGFALSILEPPVPPPLYNALEVKR